MLDINNLLISTVVATTNSNKVIELQKSFISCGVSCELQHMSLQNLEEADETGKTFQENALLKASHYANKLKQNVISEDSGLVVPDINNMPGIFSKRWADGGSYNNAFLKIQSALKNKNLDINGTVAYFETCIILYIFHQNIFITARGRVFGKLSYPPVGEGGFGYDPIFTPEGSNQTFGEMSILEKNKFSHRHRAVVALIDNIKSLND